VSEDRLLKEIDRGQKAKAVLDNPVFLDTIQALRDSAVHEMVSAPNDDLERVRLAKMCHTVTEAFVKRLIHHMQTGEMATTELDRLRTEQERSRDRYRRPRRVA